MAVNWGLAQQPNALAMMLQGFEQGRREKAFASYATDPNEGNLNALARYAPEFAMQEKRAMQQQAAAQEQQGFDGLAKVGNLLKGVSDEATYQQARQIAAQNGINLSRVPQTYDPNWVQGQLQFIQAMQEPKAREALSTYGKIAMDRGLQPGTPEFGDFVAKAYELDQIKTIATQPGGGVAQFNPVTNRTEMVIAPNTGGYAAGTPVQGGAQAGPAPGATVNGFRFKGGNPNDRNSW